MQTSRGAIVRFGGQQNDTGSYGTFYPGRFSDELKPSSIEGFYGVKEIDLAREVTEEDCEREVNTLKSAQSEFVVRYHDSQFDRKKAKFFIYTEMCTCSLEDILQQNKAEFVYGGTSFTLQVPRQFAGPDQLLQAYHQVFKGLEFLHSQRLIHRDIKPANIVKSLSGCFKICDFGLAKILQAGTRHTTGKGSDWYSAPEKRHGGEYDVASDVYSAGVSLLEGLMLFSATDEGRSKYNNLPSARAAFQDQEMRAYMETVPIFRLAHSMMSRKPSDRPTLSAVIRVLSSNDYSGLGEIPPFVNETGHSIPAHKIDKSHYQFADRFRKGDCVAGCSVIKMADQQVLTVSTPSNSDYVVASDCLYFDLADGTTGYMKLVGGDDD